MKFKSLVLLVLGAINSSIVIAGDEPVNCATQTTYTTYWYGPANCTIPPGDLLVHYSDKSYVPSLVLRKNGFKCTAFFPYSGTEENVETICDYTPKATIRIRPDPTDTTYKYADVWGTDRDGSIVSQELWVDGVKQNGSSVLLMGDIGDTFTVTARVRDNDGYTDEASQGVTLRGENPSPCGDHEC
ncbi:hypothetical protein [Microbulbifer discodermiae]|uniref:hypothetical protein n=1 Tax=Microbulbifer sp. 2201CG32-9 TaxID=3232309 RepID=UPI00345BF30F